MKNYFLNELFPVDLSALKELRDMIDRESNANAYAVANKMVEDVEFYFKKKAIKTKFSELMDLDKNENHCMILIADSPETIRLYSLEGIYYWGGAMCCGNSLCNFGVGPKYAGNNRDVYFTIDDDGKDDFGIIHEDKKVKWQDRFKNHTFYNGQVEEESINDFLADMVNNEGREATFEYESYIHHILIFTTMDQLSEVMSLIDKQYHKLFEIKKL